MAVVGPREAVETGPFGGVADGVAVEQAAKARTATPRATDTKRDLTLTPLDRVSISFLMDKTFPRRKRFPTRFWHFSFLMVVFRFPMPQTTNEQGVRPYRGSFLMGQFLLRSLMPHLENRILTKTGLAHTRRTEGALVCNDCLYLIYTVLEPESFHRNSRPSRVFLGRSALFRLVPLAFFCLFMISHPSLGWPRSWIRDMTNCDSAR